MGITLEFPHPTITVIRLQRYHAWMNAVTFSWLQGRFLSSEVTKRAILQTKMGYSSIQNLTIQIKTGIKRDSTKLEIAYKSEDTRTVQNCRVQQKFNPPFWDCKK